ncbi:glycosyltransferase [Pseudoalteromonas aurantia]|uniref:Glycosyltransferase family 4 protein n=1 Tax=Pseudoalteromonas aurantia 208 TaxID=1314867 RepID=A0ABR9EE70_9GAMM|nr:glycosyltransferase [Pseudoalteromonas aurantia]MBE0369286.1 hypothetical protein [Pseudoalteromonas aurantia 208]
MHILVIPSWYETPQNKTLGSFFKEQATALQEQGCQIGIIYSEPVSIKRFSRYFETDNKKYSCLTLKRKKYLCIPFCYDTNLRLHIRNYKKLYAQYVAEHGKPDLIHAHSFMYGPGGAAGLAAYEIAQQFNVKYVVTEHASALLLDNIKPKELKAIEAASIHAQQIFAVSKSLSLLMHNKLALSQPPHVIGNVIDTHLFRPVPLSQSRYTFITVAQLRPIKEINKILYAFADVQKDHPETALFIVGDGPDKPALENLAHSLALNHVQFFGSVARTRVANLLQESHCYINWSKYETFSVAVHEAISCGLRVISSACQGPEESLEHCGELICKSNSSQALARTMMFLLSDPNNNAMSADQKHMFITQKFGKKAIAEQLIKEYKKIVL